MDEPVPVRRAAIGCLLVAVMVVALAILLRPAIFNVALPGNDAAVIVATASEVTDGPIRREIVLSRSHGWSGERARDEADDDPTEDAEVRHESSFAIGAHHGALRNHVHASCRVRLPAARYSASPGRVMSS